MREFEHTNKSEASAVDYTIEALTEPNKLFNESIALLQILFPGLLGTHVESYKEYFKEQELMLPDKFFFLVAKDKNGRVAGVSIFNYLDRPSESVNSDRDGVIYLEYIGVHPRAARLGLGSRLFWESVKTVLDGGYKPSAVIAEIVKSDPQTPTLEEESVRGRLKFFAGLGAKLLSGIDYHIPTYMHQREIPAFLILRTLHEDVRIDLWFVRSLVYALVHDGFRYDEEISERRAEELYATIVASIDRHNLKLVNPLNGS